MKNLVFLCDGTANEMLPNTRGAAKKPATNVGHLYRRVVQNPETQLARYEPGVGTFSTFGINNTGRLGVLLGKAFGYGLNENIENGYRFLVEHYEPGDRIFLFGFSRGAYAVRALTGMLDKCGLLQREHAHRLREATAHYHRKNNDAEAQAFCEQYCQRVAVHLVGVWDTVGSLGYLYRNRKFFNARLSPIVTHGFHALARDEKRPKFEPLLWDESRIQPHQTIEQQWFRGAHADVGGGYEERGLAEVTLQWMQDKATAEGLLLRDGITPPQPPDPNGDIHTPWNTPVGWFLCLTHCGNRPRTPDA